MLPILILALFSATAFHAVSAKNNTMVVYSNAPSFNSVGYNNCDMQTNGEYNIIHSFIKDSDLVFDIGANVGSWSDQVLQTAPHAKIHAFEPMPAIFEHLKFNLASRGVALHNFAFAASAGTKTFFSYPNTIEQSGHSGLFFRPMLKGHLRTDPVVIKINAITLEPFCLEHQIDQIDFLKIDTEGAEVEILRSAQNLLNEHKISLIQFEYGGCYQDAQTTLQSAYEILKKSGYSVFRIIPHGLIEITQWDNALENYQYSNYLASDKKLIFDK